MNIKNDKTCTIIGFVINGILVIIKFIAGILGKSQTMIADAIHSFSDGIATFLVLISLEYSKKPPDKKHPYGHGNIEVLTALLVAILILITGIFLGYSALHTIVHHHYEKEPKNLTIYIAILSILIKELLYRYTFYVGQLLNSPMLKANAYDHRSDAFSSIGALLAIIFSKIGYPILDPIGAVIISLFILKMGINIIKENILIIMDTTPSEKIQKDVDNLIRYVDGVLSSTNARIHPVGRKLFIEATISVDKKLSIQEAHNIAEEVKKVLKRNYTQIEDVTIHIEPKI